MATLTVYNRSGQQVGTYEIDPAELAPRINKQLLHDAVVMYQANARQGTFKTKSRGEVSGSTRKLYRQKGTGRARAGDRKSGTRRGGGHIFAKRPRDFGYRLPRKALQAAMRMALAAKIRDNQVKLIDELSLDTPSTKTMAAILRALDLTNTTLLVATEAYAPVVYKSGRNIQGVSVLPVSDLNAYTVLRPRQLLMTKAALDAIRARAAQPAEA
jgi:large subunit ribosomal protein L4